MQSLKDLVLMVSEKKANIMCVFFKQGNTSFISFEHAKIKKGGMFMMCLT